MCIRIWWRIRSRGIAGARNYLHQGPEDWFWCTRFPGGGSNRWIGAQLNLCYIIIYPYYYYFWQLLLERILVWKQKENITFGLFKRIFEELCFLFPILYNINRDIGFLIILSSTKSLDVPDVTGIKPRLLSFKRIVILWVIRYLNKDLFSFTSKGLSHLTHI